MTNGTKKAAIILSAIISVLALKIIAKAEEPQSEFRESDGARLAATEILTSLHVARLYESGNEDEARKLLDSQVYSLITMMQMLDRSLSNDKDFQQLKGKTAMRVKERWESSIPDYVDPRVMQYLDEACAAWPICRGKVGVGTEDAQRLN